MLNALRRADTLDAGCDDDDIRVSFLRTEEDVLSEAATGSGGPAGTDDHTIRSDTENGSDMGTSVHSRREPGTAREEEEEDEWTQVRAENARRLRRAEARHMHRHTGRGLAQICVWGEDGNTSLFWQRLRYLCRDSAVCTRVQKVQRVQQRTGRVRFDVWIPEDYAGALLRKLRRGNRRFGWHSRYHKPYLTRVGRGRNMGALRQYTHGRAGAGTTNGHAGIGSPLRVGTFNINGVMKKRADLRLLLEETGCEVMGLQETLLRASDWNLRLPGFRCLTSLGDRIESERGVGLLISTKFNCSPAGRSTSCTCWGRIFGGDLTQPIVVGSVYVPHRTARSAVLQLIPESIVSLHNAHPTDPIIVMGDFNMDLEDVQLLLAQTGLHFHVVPTEGQMGTRRTANSRQIDFICYYGDGEAADASVLQSWDISDHYPVITDIQGMGGVRDPDVAAPIRPTSICSRIQLDTLAAKQSVASFTNYWQPLAEELTEMADDSNGDEDQVVLDQMAERFSGTCHRIAEALDLHEPVRGKNPPRVIGAVKRAIQRRRKSHHRLRLAEARGSEMEIVLAQEAYHADAQKAKQRIRYYGRQAWYRNITQAHYNMCNRPHLFWRWASATAGWKGRNRFAAIQPITGTDGRLLTSLSDINAAWGAHYQALAADVTGNSQCPAKWHDLYADGTRPHLMMLDATITEMELWDALAKMSTHKAPGGDGIPCEMLKCALQEKLRIERRAPDVSVDEIPTPITDAILTLLNYAFERGLMADSWAESIVVSIPKKGDLTDMNNYRGISLMPTIVKTLCVILSTRINVHAEEAGLFSRAQAGFRTHEECVTQAACMIEIIQRRRIVQEPTYVVFVDLKKAYDTVPHEALFAKLFRFGIRGRCLSFIQALYRSSTIRVRVGGGDEAMFSESVQLLRGVRQGCPLSPTLFNIFMDDFATDDAAYGAVVPVGDSKTWRQSQLVVGCTLFADDAAGITPSLAKAGEFCAHVTRWAQFNEMEVGITKCGIMEFLPQGGETTPTLSSETAPFISGQRVPVVTEYLYLGVKLTPGLSIAAMVEDRVRQGLATLHSLQAFLRCPVLPMAMRRRVIASVVLPRLLYGAELYGMNRELTDKMQSILNQALKGLLTVPGAMGRVGSIGLWGETNFDPICALAGARRARAWAKARTLKTWVGAVVNQPFKSRQWTWASGVTRWIKRFALPHTNPDILRKYPDATTRWSSMTPEQLSGLVRECMIAREKGIRLNPNRETADMTSWYEASQFNEASLVAGNIGGSPTDNVGLAWISRLRIGAFTSSGDLAEWNRIPQEFLGVCPFCRTHERETADHMVLHCDAWMEYRRRPPMNLLIDQVDALASSWEMGDRLTWILGGVSANQRVEGWLPNTPPEAPDTNDMDSYRSDATDVDVSTVSDDSMAVRAPRTSPRRWRDPTRDMRVEGESVSGAIALGRFLTDVSRQRSEYMRSRWGSRLAGGASHAVRPTSTGQRPSG